MLRGLTEVLKDLRPRVFLEVHPSAIKAGGDRVEEIVELFQSLGYEARHPSWGNVEPEAAVKILSIHRS